MDERSAVIRICDVHLLQYFCSYHLLVRRISDGHAYGILCDGDQHLSVENRVFNVFEGEILDSDCCYQFG